MPIRHAEAKLQQAEENFRPTEEDFRLTEDNFRHAEEDFRHRGTSSVEVWTSSAHCSSFLHFFIPSSLNSAPHRYSQFAGRYSHFTIPYFCV
jgi:hypothetical protein